jgi:hypothetical protein
MSTSRTVTCLGIIHALEVTMSELRKVQCYGAVKRPYASVRDALHRLPHAGSATSVHIHSICDQERVAGLPSVTRVTLGWERPDGAPYLPVTSAEIYASAASPSETHIEVEGHVASGPGATADADRDRVAERCIRSLLQGVIEGLSR